MGNKVRSHFGFAFDSGRASLARKHPASHEEFVRKKLAAAHFKSSSSGTRMTLMDVKYDRNSNMTGVPGCCSGLLTSECEDGMLYSYTIYIQQVGVTYYSIMTNAWMEIYSQKEYRTIIIILLVSSTLLDHEEKPHVGQLGRPQPTDYSVKSLQRHQQCHLKGGSKNGISP